MYSKSINNLIVCLKGLPSVGPRAAERFVFHWLKSGKQEVEKLRLALEELLQNTKSCEICWNFDDESPCQICQNPKRDPALICVVEGPQDVSALEKTGEFSGLYHILRGTIEAGDEEESVKKMKLNELFARLKKNDIREIILALNPDLGGETTMMFLENEIKKISPKTKITRLARGLPMGSDLEYADEITLGSAIKNRVSR